MAPDPLIRPPVELGAASRRAADADPPRGRRGGGVASALARLRERYPRLPAVARAGLLVVIFGSLVGFLATQWNRLPEFDWRFSPAWLVLSGIAVGALYVGQGELWRLILRLLGAPTERRAARAAYAKPLLARYVPTSVLLVVGRVVLAERLGVQKRVTLASIAYELGLAVVSAVIAASYFVIRLPGLAEVEARYAILLVIPIALVALHPRAFGPMADYALRKVGSEPLAMTIPFSRVLALVALYLLTWVAVGLGLFAFASALHPVEARDLLYIAASYPVGFCVSVLAFILPGGLGARDVTLATALAGVLPAAVAAAIAIAFRLFQTAIELVYVAVSTALARLR